MSTSDNSQISVKHFKWEHWAALCQLRHAQLAEHGIILDSYDIPPIPPQLLEHINRDIPEWDTDWIGVVYLSGSGGFWLAWQNDLPVGRVGAQAIGGVVELRRMYVRQKYRRRGVGTQLVASLVDHCRAKGVKGDRGMDGVRRAWAASLPQVRISPGAGSGS